MSIALLNEELAETQSHMNVVNSKYQRLKKENSLLIQQFMEAKKSLVHKHVSK